MKDAQRSLAQALAAEVQASGVQHVHAWLAERTLDARVREEVLRILAKQPTSADSAAPPEPRRPTAIDPMLGIELGGFTVERLIGSGGMGRVYSGVRAAEPTRAAIKVLSRGGVTDMAMRRFEQESAILARLDHPGIARLYASGHHDDGQATFPWFAMEFIEQGSDLTDWSNEQGLSMRARLELFVRVCDAISHAHAQGIVHRDLKPGNILVDARAQVKIIDFGIARAAQEDTSRFGVRTETGQLVGTLQYMSPEQCLGRREQIDTRTDVYALGMILFELLTGTYPYDVRCAPVAEAIQTVAHGPVPDLGSAMADTPPALAALLKHCLAKEPQSRPADAGALATALRGILAPASTTTIRPRGATEPVKPARPSPRAPGRSAGMTAIIALLALALLLAALDVFGVVDLRALAMRLLGR